MPGVFVTAAATMAGCRANAGVARIGGKPYCCLIGNNTHSNYHACL
jgi:hypothetical protein